jgi:signal transduction histidine kinase
MTQGRLIDTYRLMGRYDSALYYSEIAINEFETLQEKWPGSSLFLAVGKVHRITNNYPLAIQYLQKVVPKDTLRGANISASEAYYNLALIQADLNNVDSSMHYLERSLFGALYRGHYPQIINAYRTMADINESQDPVIANKYNKLVIAYKDSLELMGKSVALETFVEFDELERQQELAAAEAEFQSQLKTNIFLGGTFTLMVVAFLLYRSNRAKHKSRQRIEKAYNQLKSTQSQLIQSEKMASLGELTAGIAHEIQNPLNFVNNFSEVNKELVDELEEEIEKGNNQAVKAILRDLRNNEEKVTHHGRRADQIVKSMLQHSRNNSGEKVSTDINALADEYLRLAYHGFRAKDKSFNVDYKMDLADGLPKIRIVPQDIGRVLLNMIHNALQAVRAVAYPEMVMTPRYGAKGIEISIKDNGPGIPDEIREKIFQPFFTTKAAGEGTGLGLSLSYDIVTKGHGGIISVESQPGLGSEFVVQLPVNNTEE